MKGLCVMLETPVSQWETSICVCCSPVGPAEVRLVHSRASQRKSRKPEERQEKKKRRTRRRVSVALPRDFVVEHINCQFLTLWQQLWPPHSKQGRQLNGNFNRTIWIKSSKDQRKENIFDFGMKCLLMFLQDCEFHGYEFNQKCPQRFVHQNNEKNKTWCDISPSWMKKSKWLFRSTIKIICAPSVTV